MPQTRRRERTVGRRILWILLIALLVVNFLLLRSVRRLDEQYRTARTDAASERVEAAYGDEEQELVIGTPSLPQSFPNWREQEDTNEGVYFLLIVSVNDCTNCIEAEIAQLNRLMVEEPDDFAGAHIFVMNENSQGEVEPLVRHLSPAPLAPLTVENPLPALPTDASTPLVLVVRARDGVILDAHKPIPEDLTRRDAFYSRWRALLTEGVA